MDRELIAYFDERFREVGEQLAAMREDTAQQLASVREEMAQQLEAVREDMRGELRLVAEGVLGVDEKLGSFRRPFEERSDEILSILYRLPSYAALDGRVAALEDWRGRQGRDPIEVIRERYGPKANP